MILNSGSEANDLAWRIACAATGRSGAIVTDYAYHGLTAATHALSPEEWAKAERPAQVATVPAPDGYRGIYRREERGSGPLRCPHRRRAKRARRPRRRRHVRRPSVHRRRHPGAPAHVPAEAARRVRALGGLLVADEVQAGHGRYGTHLWNFQPSGIEPDMVVLGKPIGNGFPVAALVIRSGLLDAVPAKTEMFSTFGGNPVACAAALAALAVIEEEDWSTTPRRPGAPPAGPGITRAAPPAGGGRAWGRLLFGVKLVNDPATRAPAAEAARRVTGGMRGRGSCSARQATRNVLKIRPPLVFQREHADLLEALDEILPSVQDQDVVRRDGWSGWGVGDCARGHLKALRRA